MWHGLSEALARGRIVTAPDLGGARVLITGGTGFIGRNLAAGCVRQGADVAVLARTLESPGCPDDVAVLCADLRDRVSVARALDGRVFDFVFNLGGYVDHTPYFAGGRDVVEQHLTGMMNLIDALDQSVLRGFVQVGSSDEYGNKQVPQSGSSGFPPISPYAFAKRACSDLVRALASQEGFPGAVARLFLVYGPGQGASRLLPQVVRACLRDETLAVSPGEQTRDFCYIDDVVDGLVLAAVTPQAHGSALNIASGEPVRIRDVIESVVRLVGSGRPEFGARPYRQGESMALFADISHTSALLGWRPTTPLEDGLARTVAAHRAELAHIPASQSAQSEHE
ncbi:MAG: NAD(P)-dependent oxidoreductase [Vicinamibacterales bacterium]|nr:NAD(P)-dependent oxidoreductase [Vicinamibacterales bacterium]